MMSPTTTVDKLENSAQGSSTASSDGYRRCESAFSENLSYFYCPHKCDELCQLPHVCIAMTPRAETSFAALELRNRSRADASDDSSDKEDGSNEEEYANADDYPYATCKESGQFCDIGRGHFCTVGRCRSFVESSDDGQSHYRLGSFFRFMNFTPAKYLPPHIQTTREILHTAAALSSVCGYDSKLVSKDGFRNSLHAQKELTERLFSKFFTRGHSQRCDICTGPLRYMSTANNDEFLLMKTASLIPSEFENILFTQDLICPCRELFLCVQPIKGQRSCASAFSDGKKEILEAFSCIIRKAKDDRSYRENVTLFDRAGLELSQEEAKNRETHEKATQMEHALLLDDDYETVRVAELNGDQVAVMEHFKTQASAERAVASCWGDDERARAVHGCHALQFCRTVLAKHFFSKNSHCASWLPVERRRKLRSKFLKLHDCFSCGRCLCSMVQFGRREQP